MLIRYEMRVWGTNVWVFVFKTAGFIFPRKQHYIMLHGRQSCHRSILKYRYTTRLSRHTTECDDFGFHDHENF